MFFFSARSATCACHNRCCVIGNPHASSFPCSGDRRALHSFPTRRSSDLVLAHVSDTQVRLIQSADVAWQVRDRSEEHTSELQSPCNLVCRLLLEKKKRFGRIFSFNAWRETGPCRKHGWVIDRRANGAVLR